LLGGSDSNAIYGLAKTLSVMPGDKITAKVYAKYVDANAPDVQQALLTFLTALGTGGAGDPLIDGGSPGSLGGSIFPYPGYLEREDDGGTAPKAYLNYLVFDRDFNFLNGGYKPLTTNARETGNLLPEGVGHDTLAFDAGDIKITEPGFVYIYFSNENESRVEVFFDDFSVTHTKSPIVQQDDYYPFGLTFNSHRRERSLENRYLFNGKEAVDALDTDWYDYGARMYSSDIGRWSVIDPLAEKSRRWSPFTYALDNPIRYIDPDGMQAAAPAEGGHSAGTPRAIGPCGDKPCPTPPPAKQEKSILDYIPAINVEATASIGAQAGLKVGKLLELDVTAFGAEVAKGSITTKDKDGKPSATNKFGTTETNVSTLEEKVSGVKMENKIGATFLGFSYEVGQEQYIDADLKSSDYKRIEAIGANENGFGSKVINEKDKAGNTATKQETSWSFGGKFILGFEIKVSFTQE
jgi:RHS repeat-associated protein